MNKILVLDCETTSLVPKGLDYRKDFNQFPHIVQLSWYFNGAFNDYIIYPDGYEIPEESVKIHGITTEIAKEKGEYIQFVIKSFLVDCNFADKLIGFNIYFDTSVIKANLLREFIRNSKIEEYANIALDKSKRIDLMTKTIKFVGARKQNGSGKFPTLLELYFKLFGETFPAHNALEDIKATLRCYEELLRIGIL